MRGGDVTSDGSWVRMRSKMRGLEEDTSVDSKEPPDVYRSIYRNICGTDVCGTPDEALSSDGFGLASLPTNIHFHRSAITEIKLVLYTIRS
ncbi:hypothetical protein HZH68_011746 [Vespula germanica]|uniref:Uncharacterized protein n=1 Tax=Vespula germanica TaxID=30212 RepID=A0A834JKI3_VESGE|nr:hypothetical protein HZH68_011746 [Vespula germanica]